MEIKAPDLGVDSAEVAEILVQVGDTVAKDDNIVLVESDKASVEIPSPVAGVISAVFIQVGDSISEGTVLFSVEEAAAQSDEKTTAASTSAQNAPADTPKPSPEVQTEEAPTATQPATKSSQQQFNLPDLGVESATVAEVLVQTGDTVEKDTPVLLVESDKASVEVPAPISGVVAQILVQAGDTVANGQAFIVMQGQASSPASATETTPQNPPTPKTEPAKSTPAQTDTADSTKPSGSTNSTLSEQVINEKAKEVYAGPAVRKLARQMGIDISQVKGSAAFGRVVKEDLFGFVKNIVQNQSSTPATTSATPATRDGLPPLPDMSKADIWGAYEVQDLSRLQKVSIPQLNYNTYLPQVTQFDLSDITETEKLRNELKDELKKQGVSLTILAFIMKAVAYALMQFPKFNSHLSDDNTQIIVRKTVHMGFAVATDDGLTVPVIQDVQNKGIKQIAQEIGELAKKARDKKLSAKELQGASFTISSQGNLGGTYFTPLVNWPQVGILGVSESSIQPRWNGTAFEPRLMLPLSLSYDHRVINGADAAVFTRYIAKLLADPRKILL